MEEFTDQPEEIKMEDLDELSQLIWDEFSEERNQNWGQMKHAGEGQEAPSNHGMPSRKPDAHEMPMLQQNVMLQDGHDPSTNDGKIEFCNVYSSC